jgi:hypothetical protein
MGPVGASVFVIGSKKSMTPPRLTTLAAKKAAKNAFQLYFMRTPLCQLNSVCSYSTKAGFCAFADRWWHYRLHIGSRQIRMTDMQHQLVIRCRGIVHEVAMEQEK